MMNIDSSGRVSFTTPDGGSEKVGECHMANGVWYFQAEEDLFLSAEELSEIASLMRALPSP